MCKDRLASYLLATRARGATGRLACTACVTSAVCTACTCLAVLATAWSWLAAWRATSSTVGWAGAGSALTGSGSIAGTGTLAGRAAGQRASTSTSTLAVLTTGTWWSNWTAAACDKKTGIRKNTHTHTNQYPAASLHIHQMKPSKLQHYYVPPGSKMPLLCMAINEAYKTAQRERRVYFLLTHTQQLQICIASWTNSLQY